MIILSLDVMKLNLFPLAQIIACVSVSHKYQKDLTLGCFVFFFYTATLVGTQ